MSAPHLHRWAPALAASLPYLPLGHGPTSVRRLHQRAATVTTGARR